MYLDYLKPAFYVRMRHNDLPVKPSRPQKRGIEDIRPVGCSEDYYTFIRGKTVKLHQELIECLFTFIMSASKSCTPVTADSVYLIYKYNARSTFLGLFKKVPDP
ncbi:hypothetical protein BMS3Bbin09_00012 [bacterium BMS3Bbin09]|nr:hypothetical protein BMS3Bbin09_00012 [bacterium BMS3Bbin09]